MKAFFKENFVLALGISLPVILIVLVMAVQSFQKATVAPPEYSVLLRNNSYTEYNFRGFHINVKDQKLHITFREPATTYSHEKDHVIGLILYDPSTQEYETFSIAAPEETDTTKDLEVDIPEKLANLTLDASKQAPDGTEYAPRQYRNSGIFGGFFGYGSSRRKQLYKDGVPFDLPDIGNNYYSNSFIGWVINNDENKTASH